jgi:hypothetical protein
MTLPTVKRLSAETRYHRRTFLKLTSGAAITGVLGLISPAVWSMLKHWAKKNATR